MFDSVLFPLMAYLLLQKDYQLETCFFAQCWYMMSKFSWLSISIPSSVMFWSSNVLMLFSYFQYTFHVYFPFSEFITIAWNLPGFTIMKLSLNHWIAISASFWRVSFNNVMSFSKAVTVLSSAKLYNEDFFIKRIRSFVNILNRIQVHGSVLEETQKVVFEMYFVCYLH